MGLHVPRDSVDVMGHFRVDSLKFCFDRLVLPSGSIQLQIIWVVKSGEVGFGQERVGLRGNL